MSQAMAGRQEAGVTAVGGWRSYVELTKPRIILLLLVTTYAAMLVAAGGFPAWDLILFTLLGGILTSGSANAINMVYDRDIDAIMKRTVWRPLPSGRLTPRRALAFAVVVGLVGVVEMALFVNVLAALLALAGNLFYVFVYTMWLKRTTVQNIVIGGAAGAVPPLVGWAAVTGTIDMGAFMLFLVVFFWTPPHFWALALYKNDDYKAAKVPMMPVIHGWDYTVRHMLLHLALLIAVTVLLAAVLPMTLFYMVSAVVLGGIFAYRNLKVARDRTESSAKKLFAYSILYLGLIFSAMVVDRLVMAEFLRPVLP